MDVLIEDLISQEIVFNGKLLIIEYIENDSITTEIDPSKYKWSLKMWRHLRFQSLSGLSDGIANLSRIPVGIPIRLTLTKAVDFAQIMASKFYKKIYQNSN